MRKVRANWESVLQSQQDLPNDWTNYCEYSTIAHNAYDRGDQFLMHYELYA